MALTGQVSASKTVVTRAINYIKQKTWRNRAKVQTEPSVFVCMCMDKED